MSKSTAARKRRRVESYCDWMARIDAQIDSMARRMERQPPTYAWLHPAQRRIVQMLIEQLRSLPELKDQENPYDKAEYKHVNRILTELFLWKYPSWTQCAPGGRRDVSGLPNGEGETFEWMLRNCAGRAPAELRAAEEDDED